jgi:hypothetical protein
MILNRLISMLPKDNHRKHFWIAILIIAGLLILRGTIIASHAVSSAPLDFGSSLYEQTTLDTAQSRISFHILQPSVLPAGYQLAFVQLPQHNPDHLLLIYRNSTQPDLDLTISEAVRTIQPTPDPLLSGVTESVQVNNQPAFYVQGVIAQKQTDPTPFLDQHCNGLILERGGVRVEIFGWRDTGVDRNMLIRIAESLR